MRVSNDGKELSWSVGGVTRSVPWIETVSTFSYVLLYSDATNVIVLINRQLYLFDRVNGTAVDVAAGGAAADVVVKSTGTLLVIAHDRTIHVFARPSLRKLTTLEGHVAQIRALDITLQSTQIVSAGDDRTVRLWDISDLTAPPQP